MSPCRGSTGCGACHFVYVVWTPLCCDKPFTKMMLRGMIQCSFAH
jgi:hypothetical protein